MRWHFVPHASEVSYSDQRRALAYRLQQLAQVKATLGLGVMSAGSVGVSQPAPEGTVTSAGGTLRVSDAQRTAARELARSGAALMGSYLAMNGAATLIGGFGLFENSPAVIITRIEVPNMPRKRIASCWSNTVWSDQ